MNQAIRTMTYVILTTDFFSESGIDQNLRNIEIVKTISDGQAITKSHNLYVVYSSRYKIEFSFLKNGELQYIMIERNESGKKIYNTKIEFHDDINIFEKDLETVIHEFHQNIEPDNTIRIGNSKVYFHEREVDSIYFFPH